MPTAAPAGLGIELEGRVPPRDGGRCFGRRRRQRRPAQIGVKDHTGGVDYRPQAWPPQVGDHLLDSRPASHWISERSAAALLIQDALHGEAY